VTGGGVAAAVLQRKTIASVVRIIAARYIILSLLGGAQKRQNPGRVKGHWVVIAENLSKAGFSWGCSSEIDSSGRVIFTADAAGYIVALVMTIRHDSPSVVKLLGLRFA
jgi:hypothetical protein